MNLARNAAPKFVVFNPGEKPTLSMFCSKTSRARSGVAQKTDCSDWKFQPTVVFCFIALISE